MIKDAYGNTRFYGVYRGVVFATDDPIGKARLRVTVPQLLAGEPTAWAWPIGVTGALPVVGEGVFVQFEGGDPVYPLWSKSATVSNLETATTSLSSTSIINSGLSTIDGGTA